MSASVLGKRSRRVIDAQDIEPDLPVTKRRTRHGAPSIYEDDSNTQSKKAGQPDSQQRTTRTGRLTQRRCAPTKAQGTTQDVSAVCTKKFEDVMDIENIPPTFETPSSVRYKDVYISKAPSTPKHRVRLAGSLFTPRSSQKQISSSRTENVFTIARQLFTQSSVPSRLIGRDAERQQLSQFVSRCIESQSAGCMYVSGPPGTGKSALVQEVLQEFDGNNCVQSSTINCISLRTATDVYTKLLQDFSQNTTVAKSSLKKHLSGIFLDASRQKMHLILLDEIDSLIDTDCDILYTIFEWALHKSSSVILVGIANALDLTDRFLPRLKAKGLKPNLLPFLPYTGSQISTIISDKLLSLLPKDTAAAAGFVPLMQPAAVQLCGKKIASQTGDLRKAFSLVRRILDQLERDTATKHTSESPSKMPLGEVQNAAGNLPPTPTSASKYRSKSLDHFTPETAPRASIAHAAKMASSIFSTGTLSRLSGLNLQQKAVLCSLVSKEKRKMERDPYVTPSKSSSKIPTVKDLFLKYSALCKRDEGLLQPLKDTEFRDVVNSLETLGLVHEQRGRNSSLLTPTSTPSRSGHSDDRQIVSAVSEKEMRESLSGAGADLLQRLLDDA